MKECSMLENDSRKIKMTYVKMKRTTDNSCSKLEGNIQKVVILLNEDKKATNRLTK